MASLDELRSLSKQVADRAAGFKPEEHYSELDIIGEEFDLKLEAAIRGRNFHEQFEQVRVGFFKTEEHPTGVYAYNVKIFTYLCAGLEDAKGKPILCRKTTDDDKDVLNPEDSEEGFCILKDEGTIRKLMEKMVEKYGSASVSANIPDTGLTEICKNTVDYIYYNIEINILCDPEGRIL